MKAHNKLKQRKTTRCARVFRCLKRYMYREVMRKLLILFFVVFSYPLIANEQTMSELEIKQRDEVITELTSLLFFQYQNLSQSELVARLKKQ